MANVDRPRGAQPIGTMSGAPWTGYIRTFKVDGSGSDIFPGDFVIMEADGNVDVSAAGSVELVGVMVGRADLSQAGKVSGITGNFLSATTPNLDRQYYDASVDGAGEILVVVGTDVLYEMQEDSDSANLAIEDIGENVDIVATAGSNVSRQEIDSDSVGTADGQLRIVDIVDSPDNEVGTNAKWVVRINENHYTKIAGV